MYNLNDIDHKQENATIFSPLSLTLWHGEN